MNPIHPMLDHECDVICTALKPGKWMVRCHISHHTTNNSTEQEGGGGGLMMHIEVAGQSRDEETAPRAKR